MFILSFLASLVVPVGLIVAVVLVVRRIGGQSGSGLSGKAIRRFFHYAVMLALLVIGALGLSILAGRVVGSTDLIRADDANLARGFTFVFIGIPLYVLLARWTRHLSGEDPTEVQSIGFTFYLGAASLVSLVTAMVALYGILEWVTGLASYDGDALARLVVWGSAWAGHRLVEARLVRPARAQLHLLVGSLIGLGVAATGATEAIGATVEQLFGLGEVIVGEPDALTESLLLVVVGAPVWYVYWIRSALRSARTPLWRVYVLLVGVAGGLVTALTTASVALYDVAVWFLGDPDRATARSHFSEIPAQLAAVVVGLAVWWYHQAVLSEVESGRSEVRRVYEYLMAAVGLLAAAGGIATVLVALVEALVSVDVVGDGPGAVNTLLAALTLLVVGGPVWAVYWRRIQRAVGADPEGERAAPTRRVYLFVLFGLGGVAALIALLIGVFILFEDVIDGSLGTATLRSTRIALAILATTAAISAYHWSVYQTDRPHLPEPEQGPRYVLLVGRFDREVAAEVSRRTGGRVEIWQRVDGRAGFGADEVLGSLAGYGVDDELMLIARDDGIEAIPVRRAASPVAEEASPADASQEIHR